jgi:PilZ domain
MSHLPFTEAPGDAQESIALAPVASTTAVIPTVDHRNRRRQGCGTITLTRLHLAAVDRTYFAWVHDISEEGVGLEVLAPLGAGVDFAFELKRGEDEQKVRLYARVVHATPAGAFYRLGCRFTRPLRPTLLANILEGVRDP